MLCSVTQLCPTLCDPMDCNPQGTSVCGLSRQEYWSGLPFPTPGHLPDPGIKPRYLASSALVGRFFTTMPCGELKNTCVWIQVHACFVHTYVLYVRQSVSSVAQLCPTLCNPMNCSTPGLPVHHQLPESTQTHVH